MYSVHDDGTILIFDDVSTQLSPNMEVPAVEGDEPASTARTYPLGTKSHNTVNGYGYVPIAIRHVLKVASNNRYKLTSRTISK